MTVSKGGCDTMALSNAPGLAMSSTITKSSLSLDTLEWFFRMLWPFSEDLTVVTTE